METRLGLDVGRVLRGKSGAKGFTPKSFEEFLTVRPVVPGAFESIKVLVKSKFPRVVLVSRCRGQPREWSLGWLKHHGFFKLPGITEDAVVYCKDPAEKAGICQAQGVTHFVDNKWEVLRHMPPTIERFLFSPSREELYAFVAASREESQGVQLVRTWKETVLGLLG